MHDDSILVAVDAALLSTSHCACGRNLTTAVDGDAAWLECVAFAQPSRLPAPIASRVRGVLHDRRFVARVPDRVTPVAAKVEAPVTPLPRPGRVVSTRA